MRGIQELDNLVADGRRCGEKKKKILFVEKSSDFYIQPEENLLLFFSPHDLPENL